MRVEGAVFEAVVYENYLYLVIYDKEYWQPKYEAYRLKDTGELGEKLAEDSEEFLCVEQNVDYLNEARFEVVSTPYCAAMLNGNVLQKEYRSEEAMHFYLRNTKTGEKRICLTLTM